MSPARSRRVTKHTLGEHLAVPPRFLGVVEDGGGDRLGKAPGSQGLELLRDKANDWHKARVIVSERGARLWRKSSESATNRRDSTKAVAHGFHSVRGLGSVKAHRAGATGAKANEATAQ